MTCVLCTLESLSYKICSTNVRSKSPKEDNNNNNNINIIETYNKQKNKIKNWNGVKYIKYFLKSLRRHQLKLFSDDLKVNEKKSIKRTIISSKNHLKCIITVLTH